MLEAFQRYDNGDKMVEIVNFLNDKGVRNIKEAYSAITGKKTDEDIKNEKELKELGLDSENQ